MKKTKLIFLALIAVLSILLVFSACGKKDDTDPDNTGNDTESQETEKKELDDTPDIKDSVLSFKEGDGVEFENISLYVGTKNLAQVPQTYEAWVKLPKDVSNGVGAILGDYTSKTAVSLLFQIKEGGVPQLHYRNGSADSAFMTTDFDQVKLPTEEWVHITIVDDVASGVMNCYVNGKLEQTVTIADEYKNFARKSASSPLCIGGDTRDGNTLSFKGAIRSVVTYNDVRTADEIVQDMTSITLTDEGLVSCYDISNSQGKATFTDHKGENDFINNRTKEDWLDPSEVPAPTDFDYSIALIGDTQILAAYFPERFSSIFDWLIANKDTHKIGHVLNLGDITNFNYDEEWKLAVEQYSRLNGVIGYTLVRGDHDILSDGINNGLDKKKYDRFFGVDPYLSTFNGADMGVYDGPDTSLSKTNSYRRITLGNTNYLILTLDIDVNTNLVNWSKEILAKYPNDQVIVTTHRYLNPDGTRLGDGNIKWNQFLSETSNLKFVFCGHKITDDVVWAKEKGVNGNIVNNFLVNPQGGGMDNNGATGMVCMLYFKEGSDTVQVRYYSTVLDKYYGWDNQFTVNINDMEKVTPVK